MAGSSGDRRCGKTQLRKRFGIFIPFLREAKAFSLPI
jgi:hypothetical protein